jgi:hypothetical protein
MLASAAFGCIDNVNTFLPRLAPPTQFQVNFPRYAEFVICD